MAIPSKRSLAALRASGQGHTFAVVPAAPKAAVASTVTMLVAVGSVATLGCGTGLAGDGTDRRPTPPTMNSDGGVGAVGDGGGLGSDHPSAPSSDAGVAYLHADLWSIFFNDRTRCGAEYAFRHMCERRGERCETYEAAVSACNPSTEVYGQVGPEKSGEPLCQRGRYPDIGGCDARRFDFDRLRFFWYGAEWAGNWGWATLKVFPAGVSNPSDLVGDGLIAYSSAPGRAEAAMGGVNNHGMDADGDGARDDSRCVMQSSGDDRYRQPFGGFAWIAVPANRTLTVVAAAGSNFGGNAFDGCHRGAATQSPWIEGAPGAQLGCVYAQEISFEAGAHYYFSYGQLVRLDEPSPPRELVDGFALSEVGQDIGSAGSCI